MSTLHYKSFILQVLANISGIRNHDNQITFKLNDYHIKLQDVIEKDPWTQPNTTVHDHQLNTTDIATVSTLFSNSADNQTNVLLSTIYESSNDLDVLSPTSSQAHNDLDVLSPTSSQAHNDLDVLSPTSSQAHNDLDVFSPTSSQAHNDLDVLSPTSSQAHNDLDVLSPTSSQANIDHEFTSESYTSYLNDLESTSSSFSTYGNDLDTISSSSLTPYSDHPVLSPISPVKEDEYDSAGAMWFIVATILIYALSIMVMIGANLSRSLQDDEVKNFLKSYTALDVKKYEKVKVKTVLTQKGIILDNPTPPSTPDLSDIREENDDDYEEDTDVTTY